MTSKHHPAYEEAMFFRDLPEYFADELHYDIDIIDGNDTEEFAPFRLATMPYSDIKAALEPKSERPSPLMQALISRMGRYINGMMIDAGFHEDYYDVETPIVCCNKGCSRSQTPNQFGNHHLIGYHPDEKVQYPVNYLSVCDFCWEKCDGFAGVEIDQQTKEYELMVRFFYEMMARFFQRILPETVNLFEGSLESKGRQIIDHLSVADTSGLRSTYLEYHLKGPVVSVKRKRQDKENQDNTGESSAKKRKVQQ